MRILVVGNGLVPGPDLALQPVHGEVDLGDPRGRLVLLVAVEGHSFHRVAVFSLDEVARLHEHAARAAGGIEDHAVVGLDHVDDGLDDGGRGEKLAVIVRALLRELGEEVFVDAAEHVARGRAQRLGIEGPHHLFENIVLEALVVLRQLPGKRREMLFHGVHRGGHVGAESAVLRHLQQHVIACRLGQHQGTAAGEIGLDEREVRHSASGPVGFDGLQRRVVAVRRMPQEDQAQDGHEVLVRREIRIGPQPIRDPPELRLEPLDAGEVIRNHSSVVSPVFLSIEGALVPYGASGRSHSWFPGTTTGRRTRQLRLLRRELGSPAGGGRTSGLSCSRSACASRFERSQLW